MFGDEIGAAGFKRRVRLVDAAIDGLLIAFRAAMHSTLCQSELSACLPVKIGFARKVAFLSPRLADD